MKCKRCKDAKHYRDKDGKNRRCECVLEALRLSRCREAGVPEILADVPLEKLTRQPELVNTVEAAIYNLNQFKPQRHVLWLVGSKNRCARAAAYAMRRFMEWGIVGYNARRVTLHDLIEFHFDKDKWDDWMRDCKMLPLVVVDLSNDGNHKIGPVVLERVYAVRSGMRAVTVFTSSDDVGQMPTRYGHEVAARFARGREVTRISLLTTKVEPKRASK